MARGGRLILVIPFESHAQRLAWEEGWARMAPSDGEIEQFAREERARIERETAAKLRRRLR